MKQRTPQLDPKRWARLQTYAKQDPGLVGALARSVTKHYLPHHLDRLWDQLTQLYGKQPTEITAEEFFCSDLNQAVCILAGPEWAEQVPELLALCREGPFSTSPWRRSYRSKCFSYYAPQGVELLVSLIGLSCYAGTLKDWLYCGAPASGSYAYLLALEIRRGNESLIRSLWEALMGDNSQLILTQEIIRAVVISGHRGLMDALIKRLLAAGLQEGVRQQILEAADQGSARVLTQMLKVCLDNHLFRYSSTIRAFDTWTGLEYDNTKPEQIRQYGQLAYTCLTDEHARQAYWEKGSPIQAYFALWAQGCLEFQDTQPMVTQLLQDSQRDRQILGWLFVSRTDQSRYQMTMAAQHLEEGDPELLAWVVWNLAQTWDLQKTMWNQFARQQVGKCVPNPAFPSDKEKRQQLFFRLQETAQRIGSKKQVFHGNPFPFVHITLEHERLYGCMLSLAGYDMDDTLVEALLTLAPKMPADLRQSLICCFLLPDEKESHRAFLRSCLKDRSVPVKELAVKRLGECQLTLEDLRQLAEALDSRSSRLRAGIAAVFRQQSPALLRSLLPQMLMSGVEAQNQAAMELILQGSRNHPEWLADNQPFLAHLRTCKLSQQTQILLDQLLPPEPQVPIDTPETGYGLYDPKVVAAYLTSLGTQDCKPEKAAGLTGEQLRGILPTWEELNPLLDRLDQVFTRHGAEEIEVLTREGAGSKVLFGDPHPHLPLPAACGCVSMQEPRARLEMIPFWDEFRPAFGAYAREIPKMLGLFYLCTRLEERVHMFGQGLYQDLFSSANQEDSLPRLVETCVSNYPRLGQMLDILEHLPQLFDSKSLFSETIRCYQSILALMEANQPEESLCKPDDPVINPGASTQPPFMNHAALVALRRVIRQLELPSDAFGAWFSLEYALEQSADGWVLMGLRVTDYFRAHEEGLIPRDVLAAFLLGDTPRAKEAIRMLTHPVRWAEGRKLYEDYPWAKEFISQLLDRIVTVEARRGELPTPLTGHCLAIQRFYGMEHVCRLLAALGKENFFRGYAYQTYTTKQVVLSRLLKRCYPSAEDTPEGFAPLVKAAALSEKRLVEAVMYAPQWAGFAETVLGWPGLACGVWFFHAHINETFSGEKETEVALYSPIPPQRFCDGVFDRAWFLKAYGQLGEERFQLLYQSAKYITSSNSLHRRSRLYADAALGRLQEATLSAEIRQTRDQEKLRCYPLLPIADGDREAPLRRYEFIQQFRRESRQFGAQRRSKEEKACAVALENLANTLGLTDVNRLTWQMERRKLEQVRPFLEPIQLGDISLRLTIDEQGDADLILQRGGKRCKTVPKALAKEASYQDRNKLVQELNEQKRRSRERLELAMVGCDSFQREELEALWNHPVLAPMLRALVWTDGTQNGFLQRQEQGLQLETLDGTCLPVDGLRIAHPHDLKAAGDWTNYMHLLYERRLIQPFQQVFREYYPLTAEERQERTISRRYTGHQVQPRRTLALLKQHGWTVVRVAIQNFLKNPVISMVFGHPNRKISCISPHIRATVLRQPPFFTPKI